MERFFSPTTTDSDDPSLSHDTTNLRQLKTQDIPTSTGDFRTRDDLQRLDFQTKRSLADRLHRGFNISKNTLDPHRETMLKPTTILDTDPGDQTSRGMTNATSAV
jgi:hypothetical protein